MATERISHCAHSDFARGTEKEEEDTVVMFCPTVIDQYFSEKMSVLDSNHNTRESFQDRWTLDHRRKEADDTRKR